MSQITTHILDTSKGLPAEGISITLFQQNGESWSELAKGITNSDGRIADLLPKETELQNGVYKMLFETLPYFKNQSVPTFYPFVEVVFTIAEKRHYHIPLLLNPFGYSTYRGS